MKLACEVPGIGPNPSITIGDVGKRLAVPFGRASGPRAGQPLHRLRAVRWVAGAHGHASVGRSPPPYRRVRGDLTGLSPLR
jgi:hypothetical protein